MQKYNPSSQNGTQYRLLYKQTLPNSKPVIAQVPRWLLPKDAKGLELELSDSQ